MSRFLTIIEDVTVKNKTDFKFDSYSTLLQYLPLPLVCLFGVFANILNIIVFLNPKMKDISFKYMLVISISDLGNLH